MWSLITEHEKGKSIYLVSILVVFAWVGLIVMFLAIIIGVIGYAGNIEVVVFGALFFVAGIGVLATAAGSTIRCKKCGTRLFQQKIGPKHKNSVKYPMLDYWASMVVDCLRNNKITCMNCGTSYSCKNK